jgi:cellulose synthase/poly-beta-1,6-N-acetylglucosamine synthase-like glycosyltransferase
MDNIFEIRDNFAQYKHVNSTLLYGNFTLCKQPTVSILMPAYNRPNYLEDALKAAVNQDYNREYEIVVVDNSNDENADLNLKVVNKMGGVTYFIIKITKISG